MATEATGSAPGEPSPDPAPASPSAESGPPPDLTLSPEEAELVASDVDVLLPTLQGERRERYASLRAAASAGHVPADLAPALESLLELTLQTARARKRYRAEGEKILTDLYRRTPGGRELSRHLGRVNAALSSLSGQTVERISVGMRTVGHFTITIETDATTITLAARPDTVDVESISVGA